MMKELLSKIWLMKPEELTGFIVGLGIVAIPLLALIFLFLWWLGKRETR
jgi:hypothetical protein